MTTPESAIAEAEQRGFARGIEAAAKEAERYGGDYWDKGIANPVAQRIRKLLVPDPADVSPAVVGTGARQALIKALTAIRLTPDVSPAVVAKVQKAADAVLSGDEYVPVPDTAART